MAPPGDPENGAKPPLLWSGVLFAAAANLLFVTLGYGMLVRLGAPPQYGILASLVGPAIAGAFTAYYVKQRGGIHAFIGGILSAPLIALIVFSGVWQLGILAGACCGFGGALTEILRRRG